MGEQVWQYISHGIEWKKHKYVAKVEIKPKKYRYFYTKSSYEAYLAKEKKLKEQQVSYESKSKSNALSDFLSKFLFKSNSAKVLKSNHLSNVKKYINSFYTKSVSSISSSVVKGKKFVEDIVGITAKNNYQIAKSVYKKAEAKVARNKVYVDSEAKRVIKENKGIPDKQSGNINTRYRSAVIAKNEAKKALSKAENNYNKSLMRYIDNGKKAVEDFYNKHKRKTVKELLDEVVKEEEASKKAKEKEALENKQKTDAERKKRFEIQARQYAKPNDDGYQFPHLKKKDENSFLLKYTDMDFKDVDADSVNPLYNYYKGTDKHYADSNCAYCTAAYDFRRRGYDVEAAPYVETAYSASFTDVCNWYKNVTNDEIIRCDAGLNPTDDKKFANMAKMKSGLRDNPDGAYGQFCVYWSEGGGHSMVWEKENGEIIIRDCQTHKKYTFAEFTKKYYSHIDSVSAFRTDDKEFTEEALKTVVEKD